MMCRGMRSEIPVTLLTSQSPLKVDATCIDTNSEFHQNGYMCILKATAERTAAADCTNSVRARCSDIRR